MGGWMFAVAFDTLKLARKLESAGFPAKQAQDASAALAESFAEWQSAINLATREDVQKVEGQVQKVAGQVQHVEENLKHVEESLKKDIQSLESSAKAELRELDLRITVRLGGMIVALGGILIAIKYFG